jgi:hypothetical protein
VMGCSQSHLCVSTISQQPAEPSHAGINKSVNGSRPGVRQFAPDPAKTAEAASARASAVAAAEQLLKANKGVNYRDTYVRATLVSYGGSCRVFTAVNKHTNRSVAIKTIAKVCVHVQDPGVCLKAQHADLPCYVSVCLAARIWPLENCTAYSTRQLFTSSSACFVTTQQ